MTMFNDIRARHREDEPAWDNGYSDGVTWFEETYQELRSDGKSAPAKGWPSGNSGPNPSEALVSALSRQQLADVLGLTTDQVAEHGEKWNRALRDYTNGWFYAIEVCALETQDQE